MSDPTPSGDIALLAVTESGLDPVDVARVRNAKRGAAARLAIAATHLPRCKQPLTEHMDFERLRVNVAHVVAPGLVKWR